MNIKIRPDRRQAVTLVAAVLLVCLFICFLAGMLLVAVKIIRAAERIGNRNPPEHDTNNAALWGLPERTVTGTLTLLASPVLADGSQPVRQVIEFSTNLTDWQPFTNRLTCTPEDFQPLPLPGCPAGFYRITLSKP